MNVLKENKGFAGMFLKEYNMFNEPTGDKGKLISKIREKQAESGKYTDAQMEKSYVKLMKLDIEKLTALSKMNILAIKKAGY